MKLKNKIYLFFNILLVLVLCTAIPVVGAAEFRMAKKGGNVSTAKNEQPVNLYTAGNMVSIDGDVKKDLVSFGNIININGNVGDDLTAVGGTILVRGDVGGSLRVAGGNVMINGKVSDDLIVAGGNVAISKSSSVGGDVIVAGGLVSIEAPVAGSVRLAGGRAIINSKISGDVTAKLSEFLELDSNAIISGSLAYKAPNDLVLKEGAKIMGEAKFSKTTPKKLAWSPSSFSGALLGLITIKFLLSVLALIAAGMVLVYLFSKITAKIVKSALKSFWPNLGVGFAALFLTPVTCVILLITIIGVKLALILGIIYALVVFLAALTGSIALGAWLIKVIGKKEKYAINWQAVVVGAAAFNVLKIIPIIGWAINLIFMLIALGAIYKMLYERVISVKSLKEK